MPVAAPSPTPFPFPFPFPFTDPVPARPVSVMPFENLPMNRSLIAPADPTRRTSVRPAIAAACACALVPAIAQSRDRLGRDAEAILEYESATAGYRSLDDGPATADAPAAPDAPVPGRAVEDGPAEMPAETPAETLDQAPDAAVAEPVPEPVDADATPVPAPVRKLQESTASRRGTKPENDPEDAPASRRPVIEYESAMEAYEMFEESDGPDWVGANDEVGRIGGWKTYAREIYESASDDELNDGDRR